MIRFQNYLEKFPKLLGNIEEFEISKYCSFGNNSW
jgi:hypothetical protein